MRDAVMSAQGIAGRFVSVDEHKGKGTVYNAADSSTRRRGGGAKCPTTEPLTVVISGVSCDCDCISAAPIGGAGSLIVTDCSINGTFSVPFYSPPTEWRFESSTAFGCENYSGHDCATDIDPTGTGFDLFVICQANGLLTVLMSGINCTVTLFYATNVHLGVAAANTLVCGTSGPPALSPVLIGASGGTATVTA